MNGVPSSNREDPDQTAPLGSGYAVFVYVCLSDGVSKLFVVCKYTHSIEMVKIDTEENEFRLNDSKRIIV